MALKPTGGKNESNKSLLIAGLLCIFLGISWFAYEMLRPPNEKEIAEEKDRLKNEAEKAKLNATARQPVPPPAPTPPAK